MELRFKGSCFVSQLKTTKALFGSRSQNPTSLHKPAKAIAAEEAISQNLTVSSKKQLISSASLVTTFLAEPFGRAPPRDIEKPKLKLLKSPKGGP